MPKALTTVLLWLDVATVAVAGAPPAGAHGFAERYDLPIPFSLYLVGAAAAVAVSFLAVGLFAKASPRQATLPRINLLRFALARMLAQPVVEFG